VPWGAVCGTSESESVPWGAVCGTSETVGDFMFPLKPSFKLKF